MTLLERMKTQAVLSDLAPILNQMIKTVNAMSNKVFAGENVHLANDSTNALSVTAEGVYTLDSILEAGKDLRSKYEAHRVLTSSHPSADATNTVTDTSPIDDVYILLNEIKTDYNAHRVLTAGSVHGGADTVDVVDVVNATTKATAIALANQLKTMFNAHIILTDGSVHGAEDTANEVTLDDLETDATWTLVMGMADGLRTAYEAHRILTAGSVHGGADATNTVSQTAIGVVQTAINGLLNEIKTDFNAHIILLTSHTMKDDSMKITASNASSLETSVTLAKSLISSYEDHRTTADEISEFPNLPLIDVE